MNYFHSITPLEVKDFVKSEGWEIVKEALPHRFFVLYNESMGAQISMAMDKSAPDYDEAIQRSIEKLSNVYHCSSREIIERIKTFDKDVFSIRILDKYANEGYIPLSSATRFIESAQQVLMSSACMVKNPRHKFTKIQIKEAKNIINRAQFRHTDIGSFILNIACDLKEDDDQFSLDGCSEIPTTRKVIERIALSASKIVNSIEEDSYSELITDIENEDRPLFSSNFCDALYNFYVDETNADVELRFRWSRQYRQTINISTVTIKNEYFSRIKNISETLKKRETPLVGTFVGTVETLDGDLNEDDTRCGEVRLALMSEEDNAKQVINAKIFLDPTNYQKAYIAHGSKGTFVKVTGKLLPGRQPRSLVDVESFEVI